MLTFIIVVAVFAIIGLLLPKIWLMVPAKEVWIVETFKKPSWLVKTGFWSKDNFKIPIIQTVRKVDLKKDVRDIEKHEVQTRDNALVPIDVIITAWVKDPEGKDDDHFMEEPPCQFTYNFKDKEELLEKLEKVTYGLMYDWCINHYYQEEEGQELQNPSEKEKYRGYVKSCKQPLAEYIHDRLGDDFDDMGVDFEVTVKKVYPPRRLIEAMQRQREAQWEGKAKVTEADYYKASEERMGEGDGLRVKKKLEKTREAIEDMDKSESIDDGKDLYLKDKKLDVWEKIGKSPSTKIMSTDPDTDIRIQVELQDEPREGRKDKKDKKKEGGKK